jgi:hypothetical protein
MIDTNLVRTLAEVTEKEWDVEVVATMLRSCADEIEMYRQDQKDVDEVVRRQDLELDALEAERDYLRQLIGDALGVDWKKRAVKLLAD